MRPRTLAAAAALALAIARPAASQMCPPPRVALVLRDAGGAVVRAEAFDSVTFGPGMPPGHSPIIQRDSVPGAGGTVPALVWQARRCVVGFESVTLWSGGRPMRLFAALWLQTVGGAQPRTPHRIVLELPPFRPGRWTLTPCGSPVGDTGWTLVPPTRWRRLHGAPPVRHAACPAGTVGLSLPRALPAHADTARTDL